MGDWRILILVVAIAFASGYALRELLHESSPESGVPTASARPAMAPKVALPIKVAGPSVPAYPAPKPDPPPAADYTALSSGGSTGTTGTYTPPATTYTPPSSSPSGGSSPSRPHGISIDSK